MPSLKEIRNRITSVGSTMQITSAMKMVSAAKLKRAQDAITQMRPYAEKLQEILGNLSATLDISDNAYAESRTVNNVLIIAVTSNRGLCGGFNNNIIKRVNHLVNVEYAAENPRVLCLGKKIKDTYKKSKFYYINDEIAPVEDIFSVLSFDNAAVIANDLMKRFVNKEFDKVVVVYNKFVNAATQDVITEQILPIVKNEQENSAATADYIFEPSKQEIVEDLIPKSLKIQLFKALLDSNAAEHGARMTAMHKATDNAKELQKSLKLSYNKARQAAITNEILEIVGGAEALNS
ncbi:ATP synthase F1 subunit gamma [Crocinitomicaceae bacterium CZZ-1]|uniref:ATP synthase gamma chain n=1 Tax=Taishania pollutisoli TaxID=2766479 RepID=A0A8J6TXC5_9FLAO|nr:ATP synthase F1 subunit gamma [Taishania pollutisoli]MBC9812326.1 ATP synthase F1 subunit gamma [Taishania pollutisoli]MBX2950303.1 ATP synthase F1 subunit gamma [Crocinitomicaceae bacterium]NGF74311.1 ATP synthase F1 subunit gamma [Fluviicola sp. SGL-29]